MRVHSFLRATGKAGCNLGLSQSTRYPAIQSQSLGYHLSLSSLCVSLHSVKEKIIRAVIGPEVGLMASKQVLVIRTLHEVTGIILNPKNIWMLSVYASNTHMNKKLCVYLCNLFYVCVCWGVAWTWMFAWAWETNLIWMIHFLRT